MCQLSSSLPTSFRHLTTQPSTRGHAHIFPQIGGFTSSLRFPAATVPAGFTEILAMPVGLEIVGVLPSDQLLLNISFAVEELVKGCRAPKLYHSGVLLQSKILRLIREWWPQSNPRSKWQLQCLEAWISGLTDSNIWWSTEGNYLYTKVCRSTLE